MANNEEDGLIVETDSEASTSSNESSDNEELDGSQQEKQQRLLTWRAPPEDSLSDWAIEIINEDDGTSQTYHVHKHILAFGEYYSQYFVTLFQNRTLQENRSNTSTVGLPDLAAKAFPRMLDIMYGVKNIDMSNQEVGLYYLADYFQVSALERKIKRRLRSHLITLENATQYYKDAQSFDPPIQVFINRVEKVCVNEFWHGSLGPSAKILTVLTPESLRNIMSRVLDTNGHLSEVVVAYCQHRAGTMKEETFNSLTIRNMLPFITLDAAQKLIELQNSITRSAAKKPMEEESDLERRCFRAIEQNFHQIDLSNHSDKTLQFLLTRSPDRAAKTIAALSSSTKRHADSELGEAKKRHKAELSQAKRQHDAELAKVQLKKVNRK